MNLFLEKKESRKKAANRHRNRQKNFLPKLPTMIDVKRRDEQKKVEAKKVYESGTKKITGIDATEVAKLG